MGEFLLNNIALVGLFLASGVMLFWPEIQKLAGGAGAAEIGTLEATRLMNQGSLVLDVRDEKDYLAGHLPKARHIPLPDLAARVAEIGKFKAKPVLVTGTRAGAAARMLRKSGFEKVFELKGGIAAWRQASLPMEK